MAVMCSKLGGCLGDTAKCGPLARTDLSAGVKGLLDKLMTYFGLESSREDPWGSLFRWSGMVLLSWEPALSAWEAVLFPWEAWRALCLAEHLGFCLPNLVTWLPAWLEGRLLPAWEGFPLQGYMLWPCCLLWRKCCHPERGELPEVLMSCFLPLMEGECMPGKLEMLLNCFLPQGEGEPQPGKLEMLLNCCLSQEKVSTGLVNCLTACLSGLRCH